MAAPCVGRLRWPVQAPCSWGTCHPYACDCRLSGPLRVSAHTSARVRAHACVRRESARSLRPRGRAFCPHLSVRIHVEFASLGGRARPCGGRAVAWEQPERHTWPPAAAVSASWIVHGVEVGAFLCSGEAFTARKLSVQIPAVPSAVREAAELPALRDDRRRHACAQGWRRGGSLSRRCSGKKSCQAAGNPSYLCVSGDVSVTASALPGQAGPVLRRRTPWLRGDVACVGFLDFAL